MAADRGYDLLVDQLGPARLDAAAAALAKFCVEVPSWGFGRGGTRFGTYRTGKEPATVAERIAAAGRFHALTGHGATVALHFPWDGTTDADIDALAAALAKAGVKAGAINTNWFSMRETGPIDARLRFGSLTSPLDDLRAASVQHAVDCVGICRKLGSNVLSLWLPDGTNSPGQMSLFDQAERLEESLGLIYDALDDDDLLFIEYKLFEPGFYSTAIADWGRALQLCQTTGRRAKVLVDTGHHAHGTNIEQIVALCLRAKRLGGFHFNDRKYADDDLAAGSIDPAQLFRIFLALVEAERRGLGGLSKTAFLIDQSHCIKDPLLELVETVGNLEVALARALLVDLAALKAAQDTCDPTAADAVINAAWLADVRPLLKRVHTARNLPADPLAAAVGKA
jgi:L-rhamnose isomerase/sugar isomerase